jgi:hypothetical protein
MSRNMLVEYRVLDTSGLVVDEARSACDRARGRGVSRAVAGLVSSVK